MNIIINSTIQVENGSDFISKFVANELTTDNPKFTEAINSGRSTWGINPVIKNFDVKGSGIIHLPCGYIDRLEELLKNNNTDYNLINTSKVVPVVPPHTHSIELRDYQYPALQNLAKHTEGVLVAPAGSGKTVMGVSITIMSGQKLLWVTHTKVLAQQFIDRAKDFITNLESDDIGYIGKGAWNIGDKITVGLVQTLVRSPEKLNEISDDFGIVIVDECLDYGVKITTKEYGQIKIGKLVNNKMYCRVLSFNKNTNIFEWKKIVRFFKNKQEGKMLNLSFGYNNNIICTKNHNIYTYKKNLIHKLEANKINIGDYVVIKKSFKTPNILTKNSKSIILGMLLGDGSLSTNGKSIRLRVTNGEKQLGYLNYKRALIKEIIKSKNGKTRSVFKPENKVYNFSTLSFYDLDNWYSSMYVDGHKVNIPNTVAKLLTIESWAMIYQDGGAISNGKYVTFSFYEFSLNSIKNLQKSLFKLFNIGSKTFTCKKGFNYLKLNKEQSHVFIQNVKHLIWPGLHYKLGTYNNDVSFKNIEVLKVFENFSLLKVQNIKEVNATYGYRYNIEVEDNHNYLANNKLVGNCHHCPATTFTQVVNNLNPYYMYGLTATPRRRDGLENILFQNIGPIRHIIPRTAVAKGNRVLTPTIKVVKLNTPLAGLDNYQKILKVLVENEERNNIIINDVVTESKKGNVCILVTDRKKHAEILHKMLLGKGISAGIATGAYNDKFRTTTLKSLVDGDINTLTCTSHLLGEGFDHAPLNRLFICLPFRDENKCEQIAGRIQRSCPGKTDAFIFDYVDVTHGLTKHQYRNTGMKGCRHNVYRKLKCNILE